ncbi:MAG: hypothetical protein LBP38_08740 [Desulfovibrio sp.]|jgi:hypothetical protein|nr:hypothetical protein [Desulfovibrio sp.]
MTDKRLHAPARAFALFLPVLLPAVLWVLCGLCPRPSAAFTGTDIPVPPGLAADPAAGPDAAGAAFVGIPYRQDGTIDEQGRFTLFARPELRFAGPGLNCSGLVLGISRFLLGRNISLKDAARDRLGDSGPGAPAGADWDFGWDLILNISQGTPRTLLLPGFRIADPQAGSGNAPRGFIINETGSLPELCGRMRRGFFYLVSFSVEGHRRGYGLQHYHVGLILPSATGEAWFYQTSGKRGRSVRWDLNSEDGRATFRRAFADTGNRRKMMLVLEVDLPHKAS